MCRWQATFSFLILGPPPPPPSSPPPSPPLVAGRPCTSSCRWPQHCSGGQWSLHVCDTGLASGVRLSVGPAVCSGAPAVGRLRGIICTGVTRTCSFAVVSATCAETRTVTEMHTISSHTSLEGVGGACTPSLTSAISSCGRRWISTKHTKPERQCGKNGHVERLAVWRQSAATRLHCCGESPSSRVAQCAAVGICVKARGGANLPLLPVRDRRRASASGCEM